MSYPNNYVPTYECIPSGTYTVCVDFGGETDGYLNFGDMYFNAWDITNGYSDDCSTTTAGGCEDGWEYYVYAYNDCNTDRTYTITDVNTGEVVWSTELSCYNSMSENICLPYGDYEGCVDQNSLVMVVSSMLHGLIHLLVLGVGMICYSTK